MEISELKAELEKLHAASFGWTLSCCRRNHADAEEVLQSVYLKIPNRVLDIIEPTSSGG